jgi:hypothetical protein
VHREGNIVPSLGTDVQYQKNVPERCAQKGQHSF